MSKNFDTLFATFDKISNSLKSELTPSAKYLIAVESVKHCRFLKKLKKICEKLNKLSSAKETNTFLSDLSGKNPTFYIKMDLYLKNHIDPDWIDMILMQNSTDEEVNKLLVNHGVYQYNEEVDNDIVTIDPTHTPVEISTLIDETDLSEYGL